MRLLDWTNALLVLAIVLGVVSAVGLAFLGATLVSGPVVTEPSPPTIASEEEALDSPLTRTVGVFFLVAATGCVVAAGYCTHMLWDKYREWRRWKSMPPGYSSWGIAKEAEERRKR